MHQLAYFCSVLTVTFIMTGSATVTAGESDPGHIPAVKVFVGAGFGSAHVKAPAQLNQFGRLVGLWETEAELRNRDGEWVSSTPGVWAWKYAIDGFAVTDLFYQSTENLPVYMSDLGRDYLLSANRIFDVKEQKWQVAWMANGAGNVMGADFGTFTAVLENGEMVMTSPPDDGAYGLQRVVFYEITNDSFRWKSEYSSDDGKSWNAVMRIRASRVEQ